jgi:hypothetical protein
VTTPCQGKGPQACSGKRIPAQDLEAAVVDCLIETLSKRDLLEEAVAVASEELAAGRAALEAELAGVAVQIAKTEAALDRYLRAFEVGEMPAAACAPLLPATFDDHEGVTIHEHELMNMVSPS